MSSATADARRHRSKQDKLQRIIAAAQTLFREKGFEQTSTHEIADRAQIGRGTLFLYVASKEDLLILAFVGEMTEVVTEARRLLDPSASFVDQAFSLLEALFEYHRPDQALSRHLIREVHIVRNPEREPQLRRLGISEGLQEIWDRRQAAGEVRADITFDSVSGLVFGAYWNCLRSWAAGRYDEARFRTRLRAMLETLMVGLSARGGPGPD